MSAGKGDKNRSDPKKYRESAYWKTKQPKQKTEHERSIQTGHPSTVTPKPTRLGK